MVLKKYSAKNIVCTLTMVGMLTFATVPAYADLGDQTLRKGMRHNDVQELQQHLKDLGYFNFYKTTTYYGSITTQAVKDFQKANGLVSNGIFSSDSYDTLNNVLKNSSSKSSKPKVNNTITYTRLLKKGYRGNDVKSLQAILKKLGYFNFYKTTTYYGSITTQAVQDFQKANGLVANGIFERNTYNTLNNVLNNSSNSKTNSTNSSEKESRPKKSKTNSQNKLKYTRSLRKGSRGNDVKSLQAALEKLGYFNFYKTTTYYGNITTQAVKSFQKAYGLVVDGTAGSRTITKINEALDGKKAKPKQSSRGNTSSNLSASIIETAKSYLGSPYAYGGNSPSGFDCSGFTQYVYAKHGISIPRTTSTQASVGTKVSKSSLKPGDLVVFSNTYRSGPSHTGIYLGNDMFINSSNKGVSIASLSSNYWSSHFSYGRRVY